MMTYTAARHTHTPVPSEAAVQRYPDQLRSEGWIVLEPGAELTLPPGQDDVSFDLEDARAVALAERDYITVPPGYLPAGRPPADRLLQAYALYQWVAIAGAVLAYLGVTQGWWA